MIRIDYLIVGLFSNGVSIFSFDSKADRNGYWHEKREIIAQFTMYKASRKNGMITVECGHAHCGTHCPARALASKPIILEEHYVKAP